MMMNMKTMVWSLLLLAAPPPLMAAELEGEVRWGVSLTLSTNLEAEVVQATPRPGEHVRKGALLVQLDDGVLRAQLAAARAAVAHQKLLLSEAKSELQRSEELYERTLLSDHDLDLARIALAGAESGYQRANAELVTAQRDVTHARQVAPFDAVVLARHVQAGEMLNGRFTAVPLYTLVATDNRVVRLVAGASQVAGVTLGRELAVQVGAQHYTGSVEAITSHGGKAAQPQVTIDIRLLPGKEPVAIGETAKVKLP
jgi:multidrug efflux system membrane fusion protein